MAAMVRTCLLLLVSLALLVVAPAVSATPNVRIGAWDSRTGALRWVHETAAPGDVRLELHRDVLVVRVSGGTDVQLDPETGDPLPEVRALGTLLVERGEARAHAAAPDGVKPWQLSGSVVHDGTLYAVMDGPPSAPAGPPKPPEPDSPKKKGGDCDCAVAGGDQESGETLAAGLLMLLALARRRSRH
jgi:MYXO-CTERM domain-containing protein